HRFERNFVVALGNLVGPTDAGQHQSGVKQKLAVFDVHFAVAGEIGDLPPLERFAVEQALPVTALAQYRTCRGHDRDSQQNRVTPRPALANQAGGFQSGSETTQSAEPMTYPVASLSV